MKLSMMKNCVLQTFVWSINRQPASDDSTPGDKREIGGITQNCVACRLNVETMESLNKHFCLYLHSQWGKYPLKPAWVHKAYIVGWMNIFCLINLLPSFCHDLAEGCDIQCFCSDSWFSCNFQLFSPGPPFSQLSRHIHRTMSLFCKIESPIFLHIVTNTTELGK